MKYAALVTYPLSAAYRERLEAALGARPEYVSVAELRRRSLSGLLRTLWQWRGRRLLLPLEDPGGAVLLPVLETLAACSPARTIEVVRDGMERHRVSRISAMHHFLRMVAASFAVRRSARRCDRELTGLLDAPRIEPAPVTARRVLYLKTNLWFGVKAGGSVGHIAGVANGLMDAGYELVFAAAEEPVMLKPGYRFVRVEPPATFGLPSELNYYSFQETFALQVEKALGDEAPGLIYQRLSLANYSGVQLSRHYRVPLVVEYNGSEAWIAKHWGNPLRYHDLAVKAEEAMLRHAHLVVCVSDVLRDELLERGVEAERIVVYPNCVDPEIFDVDRFSESERTALRKRHGIDPEATVITFVGTFGQWHGVEVFADAVRRLVDANRDWLEEHRVHFLFVGDGLKMPEVRERIGASPYSRFVTLTGLVPQAEAPLYLAASDILVSPHVNNADGSRFFGSPTKLFEYMAMGKGIIASELEQLGQVLTPAMRVGEEATATFSLPADEVALLTTPGSVDELTQGIHILVEQPEMAARLGEHARRRVLSNYTWQHHVRQILDGLRLEESESRWCAVSLREQEKCEA